MNTIGCTARGRCRGVGVSWGEGKASGGIYVGLEVQAKFHGI